MTVEEVKKFLGRGYRIKERVKAKEARIDSWRQIAESITAELKPVVSYSSTPSKKIETAAVNIADLQAEILTEINELVQVEQEISKAIRESALDDTDRLILELRYLNYEKWEEIAVDLNYAYRWIMRRHKRALALLAENWPC